MLIISQEIWGKKRNFTAEHICLGSLPFSRPQGHPPAAWVGFTTVYPALAKNKGFNSKTCTEYIHVNTLRINMCRNYLE